MLSGQAQRPSDRQTLEKNFLFVCCSNFIWAIKHFFVGWNGFFFPFAIQRPGLIYSGRLQERELNELLLEIGVCPPSRFLTNLVLTSFITAATVQYWCLCATKPTLASLTQINGENIQLHIPKATEIIEFCWREFVWCEAWIQWSSAQLFKSYILRGETGQDYLMV